MLYLAEFYLPAVGVPLAAFAERARLAADQMNESGTAVRFVRAIHVAQDESCFVIYQAESPGAVAAAGAAAGFMFDSVVEAAEIP
jgi:Protein of unknown function (DUF4242)